MFIAFYKIHHQVMTLFFHKNLKSPPLVHTFIAHNLVQWGNTWKSKLESTLLVKSIQFLNYTGLQGRQWYLQSELWKFHMCKWHTIHLSHVKNQCSTIFQMDNYFHMEERYSNSFIVSNICNEYLETTGLKCIRRLLVVARASNKYPIFP